VVLNNISKSGSGTSWSWDNTAAGDYTITYGAVPNWDTPASETKTLSGGGSISFTGTYTDTTPPTSGITYPEMDRTYTTLLTISGTAYDAGSGIAHVQISIRRTCDGYYWSGSEWVSTEQWIYVTYVSTTTVLHEWFYAVPSDIIGWLDGGGYTVKSRAKDIAGNIEAPGGGVTFVVDSGGPPVVVDRSPEGIGVAPGDVVVTIKFSKPMDTVSVESAFVLSYCSSSGSVQRINCTSSWSECNTKVSFIPTQTLSPGLYMATLTTTAKDTRGGRLPMECEWTFTISTDETEQSIRRGLEWLKTAQNNDGSWSYGDGKGSPCVGVTGMVTLAFLNAEYVPDSPVVSKALNYMRSRQDLDGTPDLGDTNYNWLYGSITSDAPGPWGEVRGVVAVYETSTALWAFIAAKKVSGDNTWDDVISKGAEFLNRCQCYGLDVFGEYTYYPGNPNYGGWGYPRGYDHEHAKDLEGNSIGWADMSNTQFAVLALAEASKLGLFTWEENRKQAAIEFVKRCQIKDSSSTIKNGGFVYKSTDTYLWDAWGQGDPYGSITAAGIWCLNS
jgi:hypothetical protein